MFGILLMTVEISLNGRRKIIAFIQSSEELKAKICAWELEIY